RERKRCHNRKPVRDLFPCPCPLNLGLAPEYAAVKKALVEMREKAGLTQRQLAAKLGREPSLGSVEKNALDELAGDAPCGRFGIRRRVFFN
ncbi:MAG: helix-turn-helix transcriptional regulator, partial [Verrucomicrobia bacterium]|nr:helix-turn-helix transcriptional regulator [Verrucomicrobiota bacterium]